MPPKSKVVTKTCKLTIRTIDGKREACGASYTGEKCPDPDGHLNPLKSGFCASNWCEGSKAKTWRGTPAPTCKFWERCPCTCHDAVSMMFDMAGMDRIAVDNSGYIADDGGFKRPSEAERAREIAERRARSNGAASDVPVVIESPAPGIVPPVVAHTFRPTVSGRAARGELEAQVNRVCGLWLIENYPWPCTPLWISETIGKDEGIKPPSTGAITACFNKWVEIGYAVIERKPLRFSAYTPDGIRLGLDAMKEKTKRAEKAKRSLQERGIR